MNLVHTLFNPARKISGSVIQPSQENIRFSYSTQPGKYQLQLFKAVRKISGSVIQPSQENLRFSYSTQPGKYQVQLFNLQPGKYQVQLFNPARKISGILNIREKQSNIFFCKVVSEVSFYVGNPVTYNYFIRGRI